MPAGDPIPPLTWQVPYSFTVPISTSGRVLDPVRAHALTQAVNLRRHASNMTASEALEIALLFEAYLEGSDD